MDSLHQRQKPENGEIITDNRVLLPQKKTKKELIPDVKKQKQKQKT